MENTIQDPTQIKGWGVDANPKNDPTSPIRNRFDRDNDGYNWERPTQQTQTVEILHSNERPNLPSVFGTSAPPSGLSGVIRRIAFKYSESSYGHWLPLMLADRIGVVEGIVEDLAHGHLPNIISELGGKAEWQYNRKNLIAPVLMGLVLVTSIVTYFRKERG